MDTHQPQRIRQVTWVGIGMNLLLAAVKFAGGFWGHSQALMADAVHSLSDLSTDIAILVGLRYWEQPPDECHPYGHRRVETIVTLGIAVALAAVGGGLLYKAVVSMQAHQDQTPAHWAFFVALLSICVKEWLYRWTLHCGRELKSSALQANAWHHRSDALSSIPVAVAIATAAVGPRWSFVDHLGVVLVSVFIFQAAIRIGKSAFNKLIDTAAPKGRAEHIRLLALEHPLVTAVHAVRTRYVGGAELAVDLHVLVDGELTVHQGHDIARDVREHLLASNLGITDVVVHMEPSDHHHTLTGERQQLDS